MRSNEPTLFIIWDFGSEATQPEFPTLRAVDTFIEKARRHKAFLQKKYPCKKFVIESLSANHLFGASSLGTLERISKRKEL